MRADDRRLVTIRTFTTALEASLARGALEAAGIEALVPGEELGAFARSRGGVPAMDLQVLEDDRDRALEILDEFEQD